MDENTLRYLLANLYDFDPATDLVPTANLEEVDRYMLARYGEVARRILHDYEEYEYGPISQALTQFATVDLSAFYNDISKDRLYTLAPRSRERRSGSGWNRCHVSTAADRCECQRRADNEGCGLSPSTCR